MSRKSNKTLNNIRMLCRMQQVDEEYLNKRSKLILSIYRDVCWSTVGRAGEIQADLICTCGASLDRALVYLETFAPDEAREHFEEHIRSLFETRWMIELVENTMIRIRDYPCRGDLYCQLITLCYLSRFEYKESELLELLNIERSTFYDRKKEAILLFGLSLWGTSIPKLKQFLGEVDTENEELYAVRY